MMLRKLRFPVEWHMGLSENSVPLHPMVLLIIIPTKWLFHWGYTPFSDIPIWLYYYVYCSILHSHLCCRVPVGSHVGDQVLLR